MTRPTAAERFEAMLSRMKKDEAYWIEAARDDVSDLINDKMLAQKVSRAELARRLKTSRAYITKMLQGNANFTLESLARIAFVLGYEVRVTFVKRKKEQQ